MSPSLHSALWPAVQAVGFGVRENNMGVTIAHCQIWMWELKKCQKAFIPPKSKSTLLWALCRQDVGKFAFTHCWNFLIPKFMIMWEKFRISWSLKHLKRFPECGIMLVIHDVDILSTKSSLHGCMCNAMCYTWNRTFCHFPLGTCDPDMSLYHVSLRSTKLPGRRVEVFFPTLEQFSCLSVTSCVILFKLFPPAFLPFWEGFLPLAFRNVTLTISPPY